MVWNALSSDNGKIQAVFWCPALTSPGACVRVPWVVVSLPLPGAGSICLGAFVESAGLADFLCALGFAHQDAGKMHRASGWKKRVASPDVHSASPCAGSVVSEDLSGFKESLPSKPIKPPPWAWMEWLGGGGKGECSWASACAHSPTPTPGSRSADRSGWLVPSVIYGPRGPAVGRARGSCSRLRGPYWGTRVTGWLRCSCSLPGSRWWSCCGLGANTGEGEATVPPPRRQAHIHPLPSSS